MKAAFFIGFVVAGLATACGPGQEALTPDQLDSDVEPELEDQHVNVKRARKFIEGAEALLKKRELKQARVELTKAEPYANERIREEIRVVNQQIDEAESERIAPYLVKLSKKGECMKAIDRAAKWAAERQGTTVLVFMRKKSSKPMEDCLLTKVDQDVKYGRTIAEKKNLKVALGPESFARLRKRVSEKTVGTIVKKLEEPIASRDWPEVSKRAEAMLKAGEAGEDELARILELVRKGVAEDVDKKVAAGLDEKRKVDGIVSEVDALIAAGRWDSGNDPIRKKKVPEELVNRRNTLALHAVCTQLRCTMSGPTKVWTNGFASVRPLDDTSGEVVEKLNHGTLVWRIATSAKMALVAKKEPKDLGDELSKRVPVALGWVKVGSMRTQDTSEWLPPGEAIKNVRVWGPLRKGGKNWELGHVVGIKGYKLEVERMTDRKKVTMTRAQIRFGLVKEGLKVLTLCPGKMGLSEAVIDKVFKWRGQTKVKMTCAGDGGASKEDFLFTLKTNPTWLSKR